MEFALTLLEWFRENGRDLPWRQTRDPYAIWLSEIILQQTQVKQGWEYWERFMHHWPTVEALAKATEDEVLREWQGLGYYSRARNLHYAAKQIVALGHFPDTLAEIKQLKGVGDYYWHVISVSIRRSIPQKEKRRLQRWHKNYYLLRKHQPITKPSWTSVPFSVRRSRRIATVVP